MSVPPLFKNFGKSSKDLSEKKFDFLSARELKVKTTTVNGLVFESSARATSKSNDYIGALKTTYKRADLGTLELEADTEGKAKYSFEADQLRKGLVVKLSGDHAPSAGLDASYRADYFSLSSGLNLSAKDTLLDASAALGADGLAVGGAAKYSASTQQLVDYNVGTEYAQPDFTATFKTADRGEKLGVSYLHNVNSDVSVGGSFVYNFANNQRLDAVLSLFGAYAVDRDTTAKAKFSSDAIFTAALEQRLYNPKLKYGLAAEYNVKNQSATPERFGFNVTFGDA